MAALAGPLGLGERDVLAERDLRRLCRRSSAVGFWDGEPVVYRFLAPGSSEPARGRSIEARDKAARADDPGPSLGDAGLRLKGFVGRLLTHPPFLEEFGRQREAWAAMPAEERPRFPLRRDGPAPRGGGAAVFAASFAVFCGRWALDGAAAWDLPEPQAPAVAAVPPSAGPSVRLPGVHLVVPFHHDLDLEAGRELLRRVRRAQQEQAREVVLESEAAGLPRYEAFARMLEVMHWERVASERYRPPGRRGSGFVGVLAGGLAKSLGLSEDQVEKRRKEISALRRGKSAASLPSLRARP